MIPARFQLMGKDFIVEVIDPNEWDDEGVWGSIDHSRSHIRIKRLSEDVCHATFYHELVHAILNCMNNDLKEDEIFVDIFGGLLHQALKTASY